MGTRRQAREAAVQAIFMCDALNAWNEQSVIGCFDNFGVTKETRNYALALCLGVIANKESIDVALTRASEHWSLSRMGRVDRAILRLSAQELLFHESVPCTVVLNEAIEIAKRFGSEETSHFVNGVLDRVANNADIKLVRREAAQENAEIAESDEAA